MIGTPMRGDSGGPVMLGETNKLIGVHSFGARKPLKNSDGYHQRAVINLHYPGYQRWIMRILKEAETNV